MPITLPVPGGGGATTPNTYYTGSNKGEYQFISLRDIVNNFTAVYVGEGKILGNTLTGDINYHAHRALQELSYDTLKSYKSLEIEICPNLKMPLPHDYVNYVKLTWSDANGIEHVLYPTSKTSDPFAVEQTQDNCENCGDSSSSYQYDAGNLKSQEINCGTEDITCTFQTTNLLNSDHASGSQVRNYVNGKVTSMGGDGSFSDQDGIDYFDKWIGHVDEYCLCLKNSQATTNCGDQLDWNNFNRLHTNLYNQLSIGAGWSNLRNTGSTIIYRTTGAAGSWPIETTETTASTPTSNTWDNYSSSSGSSVGIDQSTTTNPSVDTDNYFQTTGERRGLDPQYSQTNGSFFIESRTGMIHFGSDIAGKTVTLKYISDGHGTNNEMIVHKFAEEAMYKWIAYGCASARVDVPEGVIQRLKKERFAETRKAKIRLSNVKIEEITQIMRGKSKWIKH